MNDFSVGYNERLFHKGLRSRWHLARFFWLERTIKSFGINPVSVVELGCYDGKTIKFINPTPQRYVGYDANWEGGLDITRKAWKNPNYEFCICDQPEQISTEELFDMAICMETLEHIPPIMVDPYIEKLSKIATYLIVTVPVEKGPVFLFKHLGKILSGYQHENYTLREFFYASLGIMNKVERNQHKGFDYNEIIKIISKYFDVVKTEPHPFSFLPNCFGIGVGIVAKKRK